MPLMTLPDLIHEETLFALRIPRDPQLSPDGTRIAYTELQPDRELDGYRRRIRIVDPEDGRLLEERDVPGSMPRWSPDSSRIAFAAPAGEEPGIFVWGDETSAPLRLIGDVEPTAIAWSPDGRSLAVAAAAPDTRGPLDPIVVRETGHRVDGHAIPVRRQRLLILTLDGATLDGAPRVVVDEDFDVRHPAWSPDGSTIAFAGGIHPNLPSRAYLWSQDDGLRAVTSAEGECSYVTWTPDGASLVCILRRRASSLGSTRLCRVDLDDGSVHELGEGLDRSPGADDEFWPGSAPAVTGDGHVIYAVDDRGRVPLLRAPLDGGPATRILEGSTHVVHGASVAGDRVAAVVVRWDHPGNLMVLGTDGSGQRWISDLNAGVLDDVVVEPESRTFTAPDGTEVHGFVTRPRGVSGPTPLLVAAHGGPHSCFDAGFWDVMDLHYYEYVARGWTLLRVNPRGSEGYGEAYHDGTAMGWGINDGDDFLCAVDALVAEGVADPACLAITGYSYGGFMTCWLLSQTDRFVAGVAGSAPTDMVGMYAFAVPGIGLFGNEFGGGPVGRWELYDRSSSLRRADRITTPLLLLQGAEDRQVPTAQPESMFNVLRELGREVELVLYPGGDHHFPVSSLAQRLDYARRAVGWIVDRMPARAGARPD